MIKAMLATLGVLCLMGMAASAQQQGLSELSPEVRAVISTRISVPEVDAAISDFVRDGEQGEVLLTLARAGHRDAARVIGRECLRGRTCVTSRAESHDLLVAAAGTQWGSAETLAALYRDGMWSGQAHPVEAAKWLAYAIKLGSPNAQFMLEGLPVEAVREAGAGHLLSAPIAEPAPRVVVDADVANETGSVEELSNDELTALAEILFGTGATVPSGGPTQLDWPDRASGFPVFADTALNETGDAAASCSIVAADELEALLARIEAGQATLSERAGVQSDALSLEFYFNTLNNSRLNGGLDEMALALALEDHETFRRKHPNEGPSAAYCKQNFTEFMTDSAIARAYQRD